MRKSNIEEKVEEEIKGTCPSCRAFVTFKYVGFQEGFEEIPGFHTYTCSNCKSTVDASNIKRENNQKRY